MPVTQGSKSGPFKFPSRVSLQSDIELEVEVSSALIDEFNRREEGFMNLRVGIDISIYPNRFNLVLLKDVADEREPILTQCKGYYDPDAENLAAGEVPVVLLSRDIEEVPEYIMEQMIAADPRVLESGSNDGTSIIDITGQDSGGGATDGGA